MTEEKHDETETASAYPFERWRVASDDCIPELVKCEGPAWPALDEDGGRMYRNTHYEQEADAWAYGLREVEAGVRFGTQGIAEAERRLVEAHKLASEGLASKARFVRAFEPRRRELFPADGTGRTPDTGEQGES